MDALAYLRSLTAMSLYSEPTGSLLSCYGELVDTTSDIEDWDSSDDDMLEAVIDELGIRGEI
jgi:hypothetical protein